jgi:hypothetical protein
MEMTTPPTGRDSADGPCLPLAIRPRCAGTGAGRAASWPALELPAPIAKDAQSTLGCRIMHSTCRFAGDKGTAGIQVRRQSHPAGDTLASTMLSPSTQVIQAGAGRTPSCVYLVTEPSGRGIPLRPNQ